MNQTIHQPCPLHASLTQPILLAGGERELTICLSLASTILWIAGKDIISGILAVFTWITGNMLCRQLAKRDNQFCTVYLRHIRYQDHYPATEKIFISFFQV